MDTLIIKESEVPIHLQLERQIAVLIAVGELKPGTRLPSVRALAIRHKIHPNTVSKAYKTLADHGLVERHRGSCMIVPFGSIKPLIKMEEMEFDDVIYLAAKIAREKGLTLKELEQRVHSRFMAQRPDRVLLVGLERELNQLVLKELQQHLHCPIDTCLTAEFSHKRALIAGALVTGILGSMRRIAPHVPKNHPSYILGMSTVDRHVAMMMNDYRRIRVSPRYSRLKGIDTATFHARSIRWLKKQLSQEVSETTVIVTHHAPSSKLVSVV